MDLKSRKQPSASYAYQSPKKILVIKICCLGDVIFLTPSLRALRLRFPSARISLMTSSWVFPIATQIPFLDNVVTFDAPLTRKLYGKNFGELSRIIGHMRKEKYDVSICGHRNKLFSWLCYITGIPVRIGFGNRRSLSITHPVPFRSDQHEIKRYGELVSVLGIDLHDFRTEIRPQLRGLKNVDDLLSEIKTSPDDCLVGIMAGGGQNPGTSMLIKRWSAEKYKEMIVRILKDPNKKVVLLGAESDYELNELIRGAGSQKNMYNLAGKISLGELPEFIKRMHIVIGGDTGPVHLAAAVGTPSLFLFGPSDPRLVAPIVPSSVYLWKQVDCSPCYTPVTVMEKSSFRGNEFFCRTGTHDCIKNLTVDEVYEAFNKLIKRNGN